MDSIVFSFSHLWFMNADLILQRCMTAQQLSSYRASTPERPRSRRIYMVRSATARHTGPLLFSVNKSQVNHAIDLRVIYSDRNRYIRTRILDMLTRIAASLSRFVRATTQSYV
jgi:hypothetical protein